MSLRERILSLLEEHGPLSRDSIAEELGGNPITIRRTLDKLRKASPEFPKQVYILRYDSPTGLRNTYQHSVPVFKLGDRRCKPKPPAARPAERQAANRRRSKGQSNSVFAYAQHFTKKRAPP